MENLTFDQSVELQDAVLQTLNEWLAGLPVDDALREEIFQHCCMATGMLLDAILDSDKFKAMLPDSD